MHEMLREALVGFCLWLVPAAVIMALVEYVSHRWFMHRPNAFNMSGYKAHHVEHHGRGHNEFWPHIDLRFRDGLLVAAPVLAAYGLWAAVAGARWGYFYPCGGWLALVTVLWAHHVIYSAIHRCQHELEHNWAERLPGFQAMKRHHLDHHRRPNRNFAVVFLWTDTLFGTAWRSPD